MRKLFFPLLGVLILFAACSKEEAVGNKQIDLQQGNERFYGVKSPEQTRGIAQRKKLWYPGTVIDVKFLGGSQTYKQKVIEYVAEWEQYANITFNFVEQGDADLRIDFDSNESRYVTWSTIGTDCKMITNQSEPTMNFVYWDISTEEEIKGDVLRAFGQVLGLELEHRHLDFDAGWRSNIEQYWEGDIEDIPWNELKKYVFDPLESSKILQTEEYDENSIMIWPFPKKYATNTARDYNYQLSEKDIEFIGRIYPKEDMKEPIVIIQTGAESYFKMGIITTADLVIDWGDGNSDEHPENFPYGAGLPAINHTYNLENDSVYTIKIYGDPNAIRELTISYNLSSLDVSGSTELRSLYCDHNSLEKLDLSQNSKLERLACDGNPFINDQNAFLNVVQSLPNRSSYPNPGTIPHAANYPDASRNWVLPILENKNWVFD